MSEVNKIFESCQSVTGLPCYMNARMHQFDDEDGEYFTSVSGEIIYNDPDKSKRDTSLALEFSLSPNSAEERRAQLSITTPDTERSYRQIIYLLENGVLSRYEQRRALKAQDITSGDPYALEEPKETERRETKYTLRALARLAALTTRRMVEQSPQE